MITPCFNTLCDRLAQDGTLCLTCRMRLQSHRAEAKRLKKLQEEELDARLDREALEELATTDLLGEEGTGTLQDAYDTGGLVVETGGVGGAELKSGP